MRSLTKSLVLLVLMVLFPFTILAADNGKNYDFSLSLSGGTVGKGFSLAGDAIFAKKFGHLFMQSATMMNVNTKTKTQEFGFSVGTGFQIKHAGLYVFLDGLQHKRMWTQVRPVLKIGVDWLSLMGFYAYPLNNGAVQIGSNIIEAGKYYGGEVNIVPFPWARIYGNLQSVENTYQACRVGIEMRVLKFISLLVDWNKTASKIYSNWFGFSGIRVALNLIFGSQQKSFRMNSEENGRIILSPSYPVLIAKQGPGNKDGDGDGDGDGDNNNNCLNHPAMGKVGDTIKSCIFEMTLKSVEVHESICNGQFVAGKFREGKWKYVIAEVNVKNIATGGGDAVPFYFISYTLFSLTNSNNNRYEQNDTSFLPQIFSCFPGLFMWDQCRIYKSGEETGLLKLIFELPKDSIGLILTFNSTENNNIIKFNLGT